MVSSFILVFLILTVRESTRADDDVWVWGRDTDSLQGRQAEDVSRTIKFSEENSRPVEVIPLKEPLIQRDTPPISKSRAIEIKSQPFQSKENVQQIHDFVSSSGFKPSQSFPPKLTQPLLNGRVTTVQQQPLPNGRAPIVQQQPLLNGRAPTIQQQPLLNDRATTVQQQQNFEIFRHNQIFSPVTNTLVTGPSSNLQIIPAIQTASISQTFWENFPPFPEPSNSLQGRDEFELGGREQQIFGKREPSKRSANATENPIRSLAFVVPADISLLPLEEHEAFSSSALTSSQGPLLNSSVAPSSFKRDATSLSDATATNQRPHLIQNPPTQVPKINNFGTRFPPRENLLVKNLSSDSKINLAQSFLSVTESILDQPSSKSTQNGAGRDEGNSTRFTRTINPESQKITKMESAQPNQIPDSSSVENSKEEEHSVYIIDIPNLETPKWPYTYFKNSEVVPTVQDVDKEDTNKRAVGLDSNSNFERTQVIKLSPSSIRTIRGSDEIFPPALSVSTELNRFVRHRDPKSINTAFADQNNPISRFKSDSDDSQTASNVVNQNVFVPDNFYFPSQTFQNQNIKTEQNFINVNTASPLQSEGYLNNNLGFQPISEPSDESFGNFVGSYQQPLIVHDSFVDNTGFSHSEHIPPNSIQQYETPKDNHSDRFEKETASTYHSPLRVEIVKPNTLHTITDTVVDGKVITTFYDPLKVTIYKHGSPIETKLFDASSVESKTHSEYNASPIIDISSTSQPSYSSSNEINKSLKSGEVNHASVEYDTSTNTSDEYSSTGIREAFSQLEKSQQDNILSIMQRARGGYPDSSWKWPE